jgi:hypothetical protein
MALLGPNPVRCPAVADHIMISVDVVSVPKQSLKEFARMNRYQPLSHWGWYYCPECGIHLHKPTVEAVGKWMR